MQLLSQGITLGGQFGINYSLPNTVILLDGSKEEDDIELVGNSQFGYSLKAYGNIPVTEKSNFSAAFGFEQMRYESYNIALENVQINNLGLTLTQAYIIYRPLELFFSGEVIYRWANADGVFPTSLGKSVDTKIHVQGIAGIGYRRDNDIYVRLGILLPKLNNVSDGFLFGPMLERARVERLNVIRLEIGVPLYQE